MVSYLAYSPIDTRVFPGSYDCARESVLSAIKALLLTPKVYSSYPCPGSSAVGAPLFTDTLWVGAENATQVLILLTGTHGVEGFVGTAVALDHLHLLNTGQCRLPENTAILLAHALTPWGYAWLRRCDEEGVDLNRNAVDFSKPLPKNPGYESVRSLLFETDSTKRIAAFAEFSQVHGRPALETAISGGQYIDPSGPFYGGNKPAHGRLVTENLIAQYNLNQRTLAVIDIHSGLGAYGYGEIICDHPLDSPGITVAQAWYGDAVTLPALGTSSSVPKIGLMDYIWHDSMNQHSCHVTLEFGTYPTDRLFEVLLQDHQLWAQPDNYDLRSEHSQQMRQHFCPKDDAWKAMVLFRARQVISQALTGLSAQ